MYLLIDFRISEPNSRATKVINEKCFSVQEIPKICVNSLFSVSISFVTRHTLSIWMKWYWHSKKYRGTSVYILLLLFRGTPLSRSVFSQRPTAFRSMRGPTMLRIHLYHIHCVRIICTYFATGINDYTFHEVRGRRLPLRPCARHIRRVINDWSPRAHVKTTKSHWLKSGVVLSRLYVERINNKGTPVLASCRRIVISTGDLEMNIPRDQTVLLATRLSRCGRGFRREFLVSVWNYIYWFSCWQLLIIRDIHQKI